MWFQLKNLRVRIWKSLLTTGNVTDYTMKKMADITHSFDSISECRRALCTHAAMNFMTKFIWFLPSWIYTFSFHWHHSLSAIREQISLNSKANQKFQSRKVSLSTFLFFLHINWGKEEQICSSCLEKIRRDRLTRFYCQLFQPHELK